MDIHSSIRRAVLPALLTVLAACREPTTPEVTPPKAVQLTAISSTTLTATVGSQVTDLPSVRATDADGKPVARVAVTFLVSGGDIAGSAVSTDENGIATLGSWTISYSPRNNVVTANADGLPQVSFTVKGLPGPAVQVVSLYTSEQIGLAGQVLVQSPIVRVTDQFGNYVADAPVRFDVVAGGGSVQPADVTTDSNGIARTFWTLGADSSQIVSAKVGTLPPVTFKARSFHPSGDCQPLVKLPFGVKVDSRLNGTSCQVEGKYREKFVIDVAGPMAWKFDAASSEFGTALELRDTQGVLIAQGDRDSKTNGSTMRVILPSGLFQLTVTSSDANATGSYSLQFGSGSTAAKCGDAFIARGLTLPQQSQEFCPTDSPTSTADAYRISLQAGVALHLQLDDWSYEDPSIELRNEKGEVVAMGKQSGYYVDVLDFVPEVSGIYTIVVTAPDWGIVCSLFVK